MMKLDWMEIEELACVICGLDDNADSDAIEQAIFDKFEISLKQFHKVVEALLPLTIQGRSAITDEVFHGFVKDGAFVVKVKAEVAA